MARLSIFLFFAFFSFCFFPVYADKQYPYGLDWVSLEYFISHYLTKGQSAVVFPEVAYKGAFRIGVPRLRLEARYFRGKSGFINGFQGSVGDFEGRVDYRLDTPGESDLLGDNIYGFLSWKIWTSSNVLNGVTSYDRDEGLGVGISRFPTHKGLTYWYGFSLYPSIHRLGASKQAYTIEGGLVYNVLDSLAFKAGYRIQTLLLDLSHPPTDRSQEQGIIFGFQGSY